MTHTLTRPLVLLMTNAYVYSYYRQHSAETAPQPARGHTFGRPKAFKPQFHEIYTIRDRMQKVLQVLRAVKAKLTSPTKITKPVAGGGHA